MVVKPWRPHSKQVAAVIACLLSPGLSFSLSRQTSVTRSMSISRTRKLDFLSGNSRLDGSQNDAVAAGGSSSISTATTTSSVKAPQQWEQEFTVTFPPLSELEDVIRGDFLASDSVVVQDKHEFRVLLYPRGGGHSSSSSAPNTKTMTEPRCKPKVH